MKRLIQCCLIGITLLALGGCLFPEKFDSDIKIDKDGSYAFQYEGVLTFVLARAEEVKTGKLSAKFDADLKKLETDLKKDAAFKSVEYIGKSQYKVRYEKSGMLIEKQPFKFPGDAAIVTISRKGNMVEVKGMKLAPKDLQQLKQLKLELDGKINLKTSGLVKNHNAISAPTMGFGSYGWKLKGLDEPAPQMIIELK